MRRDRPTGERNVDAHREALRYLGLVIDMLPARSGVGERFYEVLPRPPTPER